MASWLFGGGSEVDLSAAERAIKQLSEDRDGAKAQVSPLPRETLFEFVLVLDRRGGGILALDKNTEVCRCCDSRLHASEHQHAYISPYPSPSHVCTPETR